MGNYFLDRQYDRNVQYIPLLIFDHCFRCTTDSPSHYFLRANRWSSTPLLKVEYANENILAT